MFQPHTLFFPLLLFLKCGSPTLQKRAWEGVRGYTSQRNTHNTQKKDFMMRIGGEGSSLESKTATWGVMLDRQVVLRNAAELQPTEGVFVAYRIAQHQLLRMQQRLQDLADENIRLDNKNKNLAQHVRTLELAAAGVVSRAGREEELELKVNELQAKLQDNLSEAKEYYKILYEAKQLEEKNKELTEEVTRMREHDLQREGVLQMIKSEYAALRQENDVVRPKLSTLISERDRCIKELLTAKDTIARMQEKILEYEDELNRVRKERQYNSRRKSTAVIEEVSPMKEQMAFDALRNVKHANITLTTRQDLSYEVDIQLPRTVAYTIENAHGERPIYALCVVDSGKRIVSGGGDRMIRHWDSITGEALRSHASMDVPLCMDSKSHYMLAGCADGVVRFWDTRNLRTVDLTGHSEKVVAAYLSQSAHSAFTASSDRTIKLWDVCSSAMQRTIMCHSTCNDLCVIGSLILSAHYNGSIWMWDRRVAAQSSEIEHAHKQGVTCVRVDPIKQRCISLGRDCAISVRDLREINRELFRIEHEDICISTNLARLLVSPDGRYCAIGNVRGAVRFVELDTGCVLDEQLVGGHQMAIQSVVWINCNSTPFLVSIGDDKRIVGWK